MNLARIVLIAVVCLADGVLLLRAANGATCKGIGSAREKLMQRQSSH